MIHVQFEEKTDSASGYRFAPLKSWGDWTVLPRVGEVILDANEIQYYIWQVMWYSPTRALIVVKRP